MQRALISVSDKSGIAEFARGLTGLGVQILSTGGTARALREAGVEVTDVSEYTGSPEVFHGRVKTLHPKVHGGLLYRRDDPAHVAEAEKHNIPPIDMVVVNLYPFQQTIARPDCTFADAIENIDIGGPTMIRSAAKNHAAVAVVTDPADYARVLAALGEGDGNLPAELHFELALKAFQHTAQYDTAIAAYLESRR